MARLQLSKHLHSSALWAAQDRILKHHLRPPCYRPAALQEDTRGGGAAHQVQKIGTQKEQEVEAERRIQKDSSGQRRGSIRAG
eukprot:3767867-Rhodomonas_salina.2